MYLFFYIESIYIYISYTTPPEKETNMVHLKRDPEVNTTPNLHDFVGPAISWNGS